MDVGEDGHGPGGGIVLEGDAKDRVDAATFPADPDLADRDPASTEAGIRSGTSTRSGSNIRTTGTPGDTCSPTSTRTSATTPP